jgi:hypothetical protein
MELDDSKVDTYVTSHFPAMIDKIVGYLNTKSGSLAPIDNNIPKQPLPPANDGKKVKYIRHARRVSIGEISMENKAPSPPKSSQIKEK